MTLEPASYLPFQSRIPLKDCQIVGMLDTAPPSPGKPNLTRIPVTLPLRADTCNSAG